MGIAVLAIGGLAVMPQATPDEDVLVAQAAASAQLDAASRQALDQLAASMPVAVAKKPVAKKPAVAKRSAPSPRPAKRASRTRRAASADFGSAGYYCPVAGPRRFSDDYGDRRSGGRQHAGNDILAPYGTPIVAVIAGTVHPAYSGAGGISLYLRGVDGVEYFYAHNSRNAAGDGEHVAAGEVIAYVGNTGNARGGPSHLHFERHVGGSAVNPYRFLVAACR
jgi:murein DD-endopeptidase MepM/ murein hydrolase activator NlpD